MKNKDGFYVTLELDQAYGDYLLTVTGIVKVSERRMIPAAVIETGTTEIIADEITEVSERVRERIEWLLAKDAGPRATLQGPIN